MNKKICIGDIKIEWLNKRCLVLISIFAHALHKHNGVVIDLRAPDVLSQVREHARQTENRELQNLYQNIKRQIQISLAATASDEKAAQELETLLVTSSEGSGSTPRQIH